MKNKWWILLILIIIILLGISIYYFSRNNNSSQNYTSSKTSTKENNSNNDSNSQSNNIEENAISNSENTNKVEITKNATEGEQKQNVVISSFSTKIYSKDSSRQNNISITCSKLNGVTIKNGATFSFCNTLGPATSEQGYEEADIFDENGNKEKGLGGGKCQVSTTLYNAVLNVPSLTVVERHPHSNKVPYIQDGKDAAVNYGTYDLKFRNDSGADITIQAIASENNITINLLQ